jgi:hypothetical protein
MSIALEILLYLETRETFVPESILVRKLNRRHTGRLRERDDILTGERGGGGGGAKSCERKKTWSSINHSTLSDVFVQVLPRGEKGWAALHRARVHLAGQQQLQHPDQR